MRFLTLVTIGLILGSPAAAELRWYWAFDGEAGTFRTDGVLADSAAAPGTYTLLDFSLEESRLGFSGSFSGGEFTVNQPEQGFQWDGVAPTQFFRSDGTFTNGAAFVVSGRNESYAFNPETSRVYDTETLEDLANGPLSFGTIVGCGDGYVDSPREACDDGDTLGGDGCSATCSLECRGMADPLCFEGAEGSLIVNEKRLGREKLKARMVGLSVGPSVFGDPVEEDAIYHACVYDEADALVGQLTLDAAGATCGPDSRPCWRETARGWVYKDSEAATDGFAKVKLETGAGSGRIVLKAGNRQERGNAAFPLGIAIGLSGREEARLQFRVDGGACFDLDLSRVRKANGRVFKGVSD